MNEPPPPDPREPRGFDAADCKPIRLVPPPGRVRCPNCGTMVLPANLEPCTALNHDVPDFRLVKDWRGQ